jgi:hypothetical protein
MLKQMVQVHVTLNSYCTVIRYKKEGLFFYVGTIDSLIHYQSCVIA